MPAACRLAASCLLSMETEGLPGTIEGEGISCRSYCPSPSFSPCPNSRVAGTDLGPEDVMGRQMGLTQ